MAEKMFSNGSPSEKTMARWERRVEKPAITAKEPEIGCAERFCELSLGMDTNSMNGPLKDTDYSKVTFDQPITEKPKRFGLDSGKQKSKQLMLIEGEDSTRILEGQKSEKSVENDFIEFILKYMMQPSNRLAKFPGLFKRGLEPTHDKGKLAFETLPCDYYKPPVKSETEDELEEGMDLEDSIEDEYDIFDDSDDIEYNEEKSSFGRPRMIAAFIMDPPLMVANSGGDARIFHHLMNRKPKDRV